MIVFLNFVETKYLAYFNFKRILRSKEQVKCKYVLIIFFYNFGSRNIFSQPHFYIHNMLGLFYWNNLF